MKKNIFHFLPDGPDDSEVDDDDSSVLETLKETCNSSKDRTLQIQILILVHQRSFCKIIQHFPTATKHMITVAKRTVEEKGILADSTSKTHPSLGKNIIDLITDFYQSDEYSRIMPGKKDYVSVKVDQRRIQMQKRLVLSNLKELYQSFKEAHPNVKCSFSKFAALRPKHCVLAGASGTHSVCVCSIHENVKLLIEGANMKRITANSPQPMQNYHDCLKRMTCVPATPKCYLEACNECPGVTNIIEQLEKIFDDNVINDVTYRQWSNVDRTTLQTLIAPVEEYLQILENGLKRLLLHSYLVTKQTEFLNDKRKHLKQNECIVICDFSENYAFVIQNSVQGIHWNNDQATVHPFVIYYKNDNDILQMKSLVIISECLHHDTIAVHLFQRRLIEFIKTNLININKITYFSDGASAQYKNKKNFINLTHHQEDFDITAEWHFFPTSHGKGACDGLGGTLKRLAARASLQRISNPIQTPKELFTWASESLPNIACRFVTNEEYEEEEKTLTTRFQAAVTVKGTLKFHCMIPVSKNKLRAKLFSLYEHFSEVKVMK